ncbi:DUF2059 domain-containing protein [Sphingomonas spermidinifaciens]|nr:DUF2059 domain-containing protein [Sphingomonas spermidinifaciens]
MIALALLLALGAPQQVPAGRVLPAAVEPDRTAAALELVRLIYSERLMRLQAEIMLNGVLPSALAADPEVRALEAKYPGFTERMIGIGRAEMLPTVVARLPDLHARLSPIYARSYSVAELERIAAFYRSEAGQRMLEAGTQNADLGEFAREAMSTGGAAQLSDSQISAIREAALDRTLAGMPEADLDAFVAMTQSVGAERFDRVAAEASAVQNFWSREPNPALDAIIQTRAAELVAEYEARERGKPAVP